ISVAGVANKMRFLANVVFLIVSQSIVESGARSLQAKSVSPTVNYWHEKLPMTPIPNAILKLVSPVSSSPTLNTFLNRTDIASHSYTSFKYYKLGSSDEQILANPSVSIVLLEKDFQIGRKVTLDLGWKNSPEAYFIPRTKTHTIPFSSDKLSLALEDLKIPQGSEMAVAMKQTLEECEHPAMNGETEFCADSLESMIDYTTSKLATNHVNALALDVPDRGSKSVKQQQQYSVVAFPFQSQYASKAVICHRETYAYAVYYCHELEATRAMQVSLKGEDGSSLQGVGVCHANTNAWNPEQEFLKVLNVKP
ncbi:hypothetical protein KI387_015186, partial [Taxus chinensis]